MIWQIPTGLANEMLELVEATIADAKYNILMILMAFDQKHLCICLYKYRHLPVGTVCHFISIERPGLSIAHIETWKASKLTQSIDRS